MGRFPYLLVIYTTWIISPLIHQEQNLRKMIKQMNSEIKWLQGNAWQSMAIYLEIFFFRYRSNIAVHSATICESPFVLKQRGAPYIVAEHLNNSFIFEFSPNSKKMVIFSRWATGCSHWMKINDRQAYVCNYKHKWVLDFCIM